jgi:hypothetical protein
MWNGSSMIRESNICGLPGSLVEYFKIGFQKPMEGDKAIAEARVSLPCNPGSKELADQYCYGEKIILCGRPLTSDWGEELVAGLRTMSMIGMGDTFQEAFDGIEGDVLAALRPLAEAHFAREERLRAAGWPPLTA